MKGLAPYRVPLLAIGAYIILYVLLYDKLQYLLDSDAVAYLTIAQRIADGDWVHGTNGLWSPLNSWLLVPFIKSGADIWKAAMFLNVFFGGLLLLQFWSLLKQFNFSKRLIALGTFTTVIPLCFFAYFQMFGDVLQLVFALAYVGLAVRKEFILNIKWVLLSAVLMGIGYYAKSYSLVFYLMHFSALALIAFIKDKQRNKIVLHYLAGVSLIVLIAIPWAIQLQKKYGEFALTGMAGKLNMSWYINSGRTFKDSIKLFVPPAHDDSPSFWEDPCLSAGELSSPFSSTYHFKRWVLRVGHTCLVALKSVSEITIFFIPLFLLFGYRLLKRKKIPDDQKKILWAIILLPIGYLTMHMETRYIWLLLFLILILGFRFIENLNGTYKTRHSLLLIFCLSFLLCPLLGLQALRLKNKDLFVRAHELTENKIAGKIVSNIDDEGSFWVISYLADLNNYTIEHGNYSLEELLAEMERYGISYYYHFPKQGGDFTDGQKEFSNRFETVFNSKQGGATLYKLKN